MVMLSVPIQIDDIKDMKDFKQTRCIYFRVEIAECGNDSDKMIQRWNDENLLILGRWAVLTGPLGTATEENLFLTPELISDTFDRINRNPDLNLELCHFWLPNELTTVYQKLDKIRTGDIYRISWRLFNLCYRHTPDELLQMSQLNQDNKDLSEVRESVEETKAFRTWRKTQVTEFKNRHYEDAYKDRRLAKRELKGGA